MARIKNGVAPQSLSSKTVVLGLSAVFLTYFLTALMTFGLNIASPMIAADLNGMDLFSWAISLPALAMAFATLLFGKLSDMYGRRTLLVTSLFFFMAGSYFLVFFNQATPLWLGVVVMVLSGFGVGSIPTINILVVQLALPVRLRGISVAAIFFIVALGIACSPAILGPAMNATYQKKLENLLPQDLGRQVDAAALESIADSSVLMSKNAMTELKDAFNSVEDPGLFEQTVQAVRSALQSGLKILFLMGATALLIATLFIITIPEVSMDEEVKDKNPGS